MEKIDTKDKSGLNIVDGKDSKNAMRILASDIKNPPEVGDLVEGQVVAIGKNIIYVDLSPFGTGIIFGREFINIRDVTTKVSIGDSIAAKVVEREGENGYIELSLKEARQAIVWSEAEDAIKDKTMFSLIVKEANKGGLIIEWQSIQGFLPASQLNAEHYPRVDDGDKDKILNELKKLVGTKLPMMIINASPKDGKLIFSEKNINGKDKEEIIGRYNIGDDVEGEVTGMVDFGVFLRIEENLEGLVHISELDWGLVEDPRTLFKVGDKIKAKIIEIKDGKISLSTKALKDNPWKDAEKRYKKDEKVDGVVIKFNKHGALVSLEEGVAGLVHISDFGTQEKLRENLELGKTYPFKITLFEPKEHKMTLSYANLKPEEKK